MEVYQAYYHSGFTDDRPRLLDICATTEIAESVINAHKRDRDPELEYKNNAWWRVVPRTVRTEEAE